MRLVYDDRALASQRGQAARRHIEQNFSESRVGELMRERLRVVSSALADGRQPPSPQRLAPPRRSAVRTRPRAPRVPPLDLGGVAMAAWAFSSNAARTTCFAITPTTRAS